MVTYGKAVARGFDARCGACGGAIPMRVTRAEVIVWAAKHEARCND